MAEGPYLRSPGGHDGLIEIRYPGCEDHPLVLDFRDGKKPLRQEVKALCPTPWLARATELATFARKLLAENQARPAQALMTEATGIYQELLTADLTGQTGEFATVMLPTLASVGVDFSVEQAQLLEWLADPVFTPYPVLAAGLLQLLTNRPLRRPVQIDVVRGFYEDILGAPSPRKAGDIRIETLKAAVLASFNERYGEEVRDFGQLLKP